MGFTSVFLILYQPMKQEARKILHYKPGPLFNGAARTMIHVPQLHKRRGTYSKYFIDFCNKKPYISVYTYKTEQLAAAAIT